MNDMTIFKIEGAQEPHWLHVEMSSASLIVFDLDFTGLDYHTVLTDICQVAPAMINLDADLMEMYDDAGRTQPKREDILTVRAFLLKYKGRVPDELKELFA